MTQPLRIIPTEKKPDNAGATVANPAQLSDVKQITNKQKRTIVSSTKVLINAILSLFIVCVLILTSFFLFGGVAVKLADKTFWAQKVISGLATFALMLSISNIAEELSRRKDKELARQLADSDDWYQWLLNNYMTENLGVFLTNLNKSNKYKAYIKIWRRKLKHAKRPETIIKIRKKLLIDADELWNSGERVKYYKVTYNQMVSGAFDTSSVDNEYDLQTHRARYGLQKFGWKVISLVILGGIVGDLLYSYIDFTRDMIIPLVYKIITIIVAAYSGVCFGIFMLFRQKVTLNKKLKIASQFRARVETPDLTAENRFSVEIEKDKVVERIRVENAEREKKGIDSETETPGKKNVFRQAFDNTFGSGRPVKVGGFVKEVVSTAIMQVDEEPVPVMTPSEQA